jgi:hypothetical protein
MALALITLPFIFDLSRRRRERDRERGRAGSQSAETTDDEDRTIEEQVQVYDEQDRLEEQARERRARRGRRDRGWTLTRDTPNHPPPPPPLHGSGEKTLETTFHPQIVDVDTISPLPSIIPERPHVFPRTVTIDSKSLPRHRRRSLSPVTVTRSPARSKSGLSRITSALSEQWDNRHDPTYSGFWAAVWAFIWGGKDSDNGLRPGDVGYVEPKYRWTPILSGLVVPFSM